MPSDAIVLANGAYDSAHGKVAHGLVRGSDRFRIHAVVDPASAGRDAGEILNGEKRGIPVVRSIPEALDACTAPPAWAIVGIAPHGGRFTDELRKAALGALHSKMNLVSGLHDWAGDDPDLVAAAEDNGVEIIDLRKPPPIHRLHFWSGEVRQLSAPRVAVLGLDCAIGKRTTTRLLTRGLRERGRRAEMIYTGQTGWLQGSRFGFVLDATPNDYVSGELEHAILQCAREADPEVMLLEGQSALRNPSGPCGAEFLLSGGADSVVLQTDPEREYFEGMAEAGYRLPKVSDEIALIRAYGARTIAVTLRGNPDTPAVARAQEQLSRELDIPVLCPLHDPLDPILDAIEQRVRRGADS